MSGNVANSSYQIQVANAFKKHPLYSEFVQVKNKLAASGFVCWVAGGAVRDLLLNRKVADFDLVTDATTDQILNIFPDALQVGASFGVVKLALKTKGDFFDLATFRRESDYVDGRRPSHIDFATPKEDAERRDFTINALFWDDEKKEVIDFVSGLQDIERKRICCVGDARVRFQEDHLRILRLLRFKIQFDLSYETNTYNAALERVLLLDRISGERISAELRKMIPYIKWSSFFRDDLSESIFEFIFKDQIVVQDWVRLDGIKDSDLLKFFYVLQTGFANSNLKEILKNRLKFSSFDLDVFDSLKYCLKEKDSFPVFEWAYIIEKKDIHLQSLKFLNSIDLFDSNKLKSIEYIVSAFPDRKVDGNDLMGLVSKEQMGAILKKIRLLQFEQPILSKDELIRKAMS